MLCGKAVWSLLSRACVHLFVLTFRALRRARGLDDVIGCCRLCVGTYSGVFAGAEVDAGDAVAVGSAGAVGTTGSVGVAGAAAALD